MASGRSAFLAVSLTLQQLEERRNKGGSLLLTPLDFDKEAKEVHEIGVEAALQTGDPGSENSSENFWFRCNRLKNPKAAKPDDREVSAEFPKWFQNAGKDGLKTVKPTRATTSSLPDNVRKYRDNLTKYRRIMKLKPILKSMHEISEGKSDMVLTCGIGVIRKNMDRDTNMNCPLLEIDLCCRRDHFEFSPDSTLLDYNTKIRLCPSLSRLADSMREADGDALQAKAQQKLDHWIRSRNKGPINPFDPATYKSLLNKIGRVLDATFRRAQLFDAVEHGDYLLSDRDTTKDLKIFDTWILFQREKPDASRIVSQDAQRFLRTLRGLPEETERERKRKRESERKRERERERQNVCVYVCVCVCVREREKADASRIMLHDAQHFLHTLRGLLQKERERENERDTERQIERKEKERE